MSVALSLVLLLASAPTDDTLSAMASAFTRVGAASSPSLSPDGKRVAFVSNLSGLPQVWIVPTTGGWPELVTSLEDPVSGVEWSPDGAWLAFGLAPGGGMNTQVYLVHPDGSGLRRLTAGGRENAAFGRFSRDGAHLAMSSNRRSADNIDAYVASIPDGEMHLVSRNPGVGQFQDLSRDGRLALLHRTRTRGDDDLFLVEVATGRETPLTSHDGRAQFRGELSADGRAVYLSSNKDRDRFAFARIRLGADGPSAAMEILAERSDAELADFTVNEQ